MSKIYVPTLNSGNCAVIQNSNTLRVYESTPRNGATINYIDYYVTSHYWHVSGSQTFSQYTTLPTCLSSSELSTDYWYRNDFDSILIILFIILILCFYFPYRIISRMFGRWLKW